MNYQEYLQSKEWREFAKKERRRAGYQCERCKTKKGPFHVHHKTYRGKPGHWKLPKRGQTEVLCDICHKSLHEAGEMAL